MRIALLAVTLVFALTPLAAQDAFPHHNLTFGVGGAHPQADLSTVMQNAPGISIGYGYRFSRYFQADFGFDMLFGAAGIREFEDTMLGTLRIKDREYFLPLGGRAILPLFQGRLLLSGGGGGAYMRYSESLNQPSYYYRVGCVTCTSRSGWGYYAQVGVDYFFAHNLRLGVMTRSYRGHTNGENLGGVPPVQTTDRWLNTMAEIGFSF
ncbi:MAG: outer membrane beta-barrel protein [Acidobacteria bacterium]|nr:outer membrane beta-barrel protein [Acidobacteriota bacterium]